MNRTSQTVTGWSATLVAFALGTTATAAPVVIEDFSNAGNPSFGTFTFGVNPGGAGQNLGANAGSSTVPAAPWELTPAGESAFVNRISITDDPATNGGTFFGTPTAWTLRHVSNGGTPTAANTLTTGGPTGSVGFYVRTSSANLVTAIALDETGGSGAGTEVSPRTSLIADGQWHLYQWSLADVAAWDAFFGAANGTLNGTTYSIDSIMFWNTAPNDGATSLLELAYVSYDAAGPLVTLVPEPASLALLAGAGLMMLGRRRAC